MVEAGATRLAPDTEAQLTVKRLKPGQFLLAIVECRLPTTEGSNVLVELAVTTADEEVFVCLEQISATA